MALRAGMRLGPYEITGALGAGGMGEVYRARDTRLERTVAIKVLPAQSAADPQFRERFEREARAASALNHPNILSIFDVGREAGADYLVTELVDGVTLRERIEDGPLPPRELVTLGAQIADGLAAAHAAGLVHRDLKPENVMITRDGRVKILDFGLAKPLQDGLAGQQTQTQISQAGLLVGTIGYISPEQVRGQSADQRSDLFSLGVVLYEVATRQHAFGRPTSVETLSAILKEDPPDLPETLPGGLRQIIAHCLEKEPARRFQTAQDVAFALRSFASTTTVALPVTVGAGRARAIRWVLAAVVGAALVSAGVVGARLFTPPSVDTGSIALVPFAVDAYRESDPAISPDGTSVAYVRETATGDEQIVVASVGSAAPTVLSRGHSDLSELFWSPDGQRVFFRQGRVRLRSIGAVGGEVRDELNDVFGADIAPDGRTFAVLQLRDTDGGRRVQLMVGPRDRLQLYDPPPTVAPLGCVPNVVRFSPDGSKILLWLACTDNVMVVVPAPDSRGKGGPARRVFEGRLDSVIGGADWLDDSRHVVLSTSGSLWLGDIEKNTLSRLTNGTTPGRWPTVGHGNVVAFTEEIADYDIVELPVAGGAPRLLVASSQYDGSAAWAPRGGALAFVVHRGQGDEIWTRTADGLSERRLLTPRDFPDQRPEGIRALTFSPDGQWIAFNAYSSRPAFLAGMWVVPATGGTPRLVSPKDAVALQASWSPDGRQLAVNMTRSRGLELWILGIGTSAALRRIDLAPGAELRQIEWSPTGEWIAAAEVRSDTPVRATLLINPADGTTRRLPPLESPVRTWSHDGKILYGIATTGTASELRAIDIATGSLRTIAQYNTRLRLADDVGGTLRMSLHPDGRSFVSTAFADRSNIWMLTGLVPPR